MYLVVIIFAMYVHIFGFQAKKNVKENIYNIQFPSSLFKVLGAVKLELMAKPKGYFELFIVDGRHCWS